MTLRSLTLDDLSQLKGTVFNKRYELTRNIGCGANGAVYEAADLQLPGRRVAVKLALTVFSESEFKREAQLIGQLSDHSSVVKVFEYGVQDGIPFIVMELLEGESLESMLARYNRRLPDELITKFVKEVGLALASAHHRNVIHRDLKPQNVLLVDRGNIDVDGKPIQEFVLLDFGIASKFDAKSSIKNMTMAGLGTPEYRSPEQINARDLSPSTDIYTFGVVLYELLCGRVPFPAASGSQADLARLYIAIEEQPAPRLSDVAPDRQIDPEIEELVLQCLAKSPDDRPAMIREVVQRYLKVALRTQQTLAPPAHSPPVPSGTILPRAGDPDANTLVTATDARPWKPQPALPLGRVLPALAVVLAVGLAGFALWRTSPPSESKSDSKPTPPPPVVETPPLELWTPAGFDADGAESEARPLQNRRYPKQLVRNVEGERVVFLRIDRGGTCFYLLQDKVWYALYRKFVAWAKEHPDEALGEGSYVSLADILKPVELRDSAFRESTDPPEVRERWPVTHVSANVAYRFAQWLVPPSQEAEFAGGALPSVDEWWHAAGYTRGKDLSGAAGPFTGNGSRVWLGHKAPGPIGSMEDDLGTEAFGCHDMAGNGKEWTCTSTVADPRQIDGDAPKIGFPVRRDTLLALVGASFSASDSAKFKEYKGVDIWPVEYAEDVKQDTSFRVIIRLPAAGAR